MNTQPHTFPQKWQELHKKYPVLTSIPLISLWAATLVGIHILLYHGLKNPYLP